MKKIAAVLLMIVVIALVMFYLDRGRAVHYAFDPPAGLPAFSVLGPFRDRDPEHAAERFMRTLASPQCKSALEPIRGDYSLFICQHEQSNPVARFFVMNRKDATPQVSLSYLIQRRGEHGLFDSFATIQLQQTGREWQVTSFEPIY